MLPCPLSAHGLLPAPTLKDAFSARQNDCLATRCHTHGSLVGASDVIVQLAFASERCRAVAAAVSHFKFDARIKKRIYCAL